MAIKYHNPKSVSLAGKYSLGAEIPQGARVLFVSGQVGVDSRGKILDGMFGAKSVKGFDAQTLADIQGRLEMFKKKKG